MLDKDAWVDFKMKLDYLQGSNVHVRYTPYAPDCPAVRDRGFKAFLQVHTILEYSKTCSTLTSTTIVICS